MKNLFFPMLLLAAVPTNMAAQVGIGTNAPKAALEIKEANPTLPGGLLVPRYTVAELNAKSIAYDTPQYAALVYVTSGTGTAGTKTEKINKPGFYFYDLPEQNWRQVNFSLGNIGNIKSGLQPSDHEGWIKLDGRPISSLTARQQKKAIALGLSGNLPNATNSVLVQNGTAPGSTTPASLMMQNQLPNYAFTGTTSEDGLHTHTFSGATNGNNTSNSENLWDRGTLAARTTSSNGNHSHTATTVSLNGNVAQQPLGLPLTLSANTFIYLGIN